MAAFKIREWYLSILYKNGGIFQVWNILPQVNKNDTERLIRGTEEPSEIDQEIPY
jgi:hypothetical protein